CRLARRRAARGLPPAGVRQRGALLMLTVLTWLWRQPGGRTGYTASHVNIWAAMVRRHLAMPHRLACVTDMPEGIMTEVEIIDPPGDFEAVRIPTWGAHMPQCLCRLALFRP